MTTIAIGFYVLCMLAVLPRWSAVRSTRACRFELCIALAVRLAARLRRPAALADPARLAGDRERLSALAVCGTATPRAGSSSRS